MKRLSRFLHFPEHYGPKLTLILIAMPLFFGYLAVQMGQDNHWDTRNYHYYNAFALVEDRLETDINPAQIQSFINPTLDLFNYAINTKLSPANGAFVLGTIQGLNASLIFILFLLLFKSGAPIRRLGLATASAASGTYAPVMLSVLGMSTNDVTTSLFVMLAIIMVLPQIERLNEPGDRSGVSRLALFGGLMMGLGIGLKLTVAVYGVGFMVALALCVPRTKNAATSVFYIGVAALVGLLASRGWWMVYLYQTYESPLFPFYNTIFNSPFYQDVNFKDARFLPQSVLDHLIFPFYRFSENIYTGMQHHQNDIRYAVVYLLSLGWAVQSFRAYVKSKKSGAVADISENFKSTRFVALFFIVSYLAWQFLFSIFRYTNPLEFLAPIVVWILVVRLVKIERYRVILFSGLLLMIALFVKVRISERIPFRDDFIQVQVPQLDNPATLMVIIASGRPWSYLIPAFPRDVQFVRIGGNFIKPDIPTDFLSMIRARIEFHEGDIYLLTRMRLFEYDVNYLKSFGLIVATRKAMSISSAHEPPGLFLVKLTKI